jgi:hypothetical protein
MEPGSCLAGPDQSPTLTVLLVLELCADFVAEPPAARGLPIARAVADALVMLLLVTVVLLSQRPGAIISILVGSGRSRQAWRCRPRGSDR